MEKRGHTSYSWPFLLRDNRILILHDGVRFTGAAVGEGDLDMKRAYEIIRDRSSMNRINIELDMDAVSDNPEQARRHEREAVVRGIRYCRDILGIQDFGKNSQSKRGAGAGTD